MEDSPSVAGRVTRASTRKAAAAKTPAKGVTKSAAKGRKQGKGKAQPKGKGKAKSPARATARQQQQDAGLQGASDERKPSDSTYQTTEDTTDQQAFDNEPTPQRVQRDANLNELQRAALARRAHREERRKAEFSDLRPQEYKLFATIDHRGFEPFLPANWHLDFPFKEATLFGDSAENTHINCSDFTGGNANFRAMRALSMLIKIGPLLRDRSSLMNLRPEPFFAKSVRDYLKWAEFDAGFHDGRQAPEILSVAIDDDRRGSGADAVIEKLQVRMRRNAAKWRKWLDQPRPQQQQQQQQQQEEAGKAAGAGPITATDNDEERMNEDEEVTITATSPASPFTTTTTPNEGVCTGEGQQAGPNRPGALYRPRRRRHGSGFSGVMNWMTRVFTGNMDGPGEEPPSQGPDADNDDPSAVDAVYGIAVSHLVVAILSYRVYPDGKSDEEEQGEEQAEAGADNARVIFFVDFSDPSQDVWNSVAIAMAVCHCRDLRVANSFMTEKDDDDNDDDDMDL